MGSGGTPIGVGRDHFFTDGCFGTVPPLPEIAPSCRTNVVAPHSARDPDRFTRSLRLPRVVSRAVLHFDAHELHHMYPFVPGYRLRDIAYEPQNEIGWRQWVVAARRIPGDVLLFQNRRETGFDL